MKPIKKLELAIIEYQKETQELILEISVDNISVKKINDEDNFDCFTINTTVKSHSIL